MDYVGHDSLVFRIHKCKRPLDDLERRTVALTKKKKNLEINTNDSYDIRMCGLNIYIHIYTHTHIYIYIYILTNYMAYGTLRFNAAFTRALQ